MYAPPAGVTRLPRAEWQEEAGTAHDEATRVDLVGDRHFVVGRGFGLWKQRRRSAAHGPGHNLRLDGSDDEVMAEVHAHVAAKGRAWDPEAV